MCQRVPFIGTVALAVWQILQDCGNWVPLGAVRQPNPSGQRRAVLQRNKRVLDDTYCTWKDGTTLAARIWLPDGAGGTQFPQSWSICHTASATVPMNGTR